MTYVSSPYPLTFAISFCRKKKTPVMHLMYTLDENGNRIYTLKVR